MKITEQPFIPLTDEQVREVWDSCVKDGIAARATGMKLEECPPFVDPDMAVSWRMGWRQEDERRRRKTIGYRP